MRSGKAMPGKSTTCSSGKSGSTRSTGSVTLAGQKVECRGGQHLNTDVEGALVEIECRTVVRAVQAASGIGRADEEITPRHRIQEEAHIVGASSALVSLNPL